MKLLTISDLHGRTCWKEVAEAFLAENPDGTIVFEGDYNDSFCVKNQQMLDNFIDVLLFKQRHMQQVVLLLGNHCFPYLFYTGSHLDYRCSGFRADLAPALHILYHEHRHLFQVAYQVPADGFTYLFTHAGVTRFWIERNEEALQRIANLAEAQTLAEMLNACLESKEGLDMLWQLGRDNGGYSAVNGPLWVRPKELGEGVLLNYVQVVGHTSMPNIVRALNDAGTTGVILTDCLHDGKKASKNDFLTLEVPA